MVQEIRYLYAYNRWANRRVLDAASRLDADAFTKLLGSSFPSVHATLVHILSAEWIWLSRWQGQSPSGRPASWDVATYDALRAKWAEVERDQHVYIASLTEEALTRRIAYRTTQGQPFKQPLRLLLQHVVNHSTYHRGQVATLLRQLGAEPVATDLVLYDREVAAGGSEGSDSESTDPRVVAGGS